jgi:hypothetical protein
VDLGLGHASDEQLVASGNATYLQAQLALERQKNKITEMENQNQALEMDIVTWKTRFMGAQ